MYAAIRRYIYDNGSINDMSALVELGFLPQVSQIPGFIAYYLVDAGMNALATVSVFDSRQGAERSVRLAGEWIATNLADFRLKPPQVTTGEVKVHKMAEHGVGTA
jgi:hypothetical protein